MIPTLPPPTRAERHHRRVFLTVWTGVLVAAAGVWALGVMAVRAVVS